MDDVFYGEDINTDYPVVYKKFDDVLKDIVFANDNERLLCASIIESLELEASIQFRADNGVHIPYIGKFRKNLIRRNVLKKYKNFLSESNNLTKEEKREFLRAASIEERRLRDEEIARKKAFKLTPGKEFTDYVNLCRKKGMRFAKLYYEFKKKMIDIPFIQEVHDSYMEILTDDTNR
mgnify:CR=1 FL=1|nr:MAG TPA: DNA binding protein [Crassvirales sp.]